jgi:hypothetical protein
MHAISLCRKAFWTLRPEARIIAAHRRRARCRTGEFLAIRHPGDKKESTFDKPSMRWPDVKDGVPP